MQNFDVFNGDADGICALHQMRLAKPLESTLITGVKRDISLLKKVQADTGDQILVLDVSLDKNRDDLIRLLEHGCSIQYFDHHFCGDIPDNKHLQANINTDPNTCTSLLVNEYLDQKYLPWAVTAAFGDNLHQSAKIAAKPLALSEAQLDELELLGTCINYNGYGSSLDDLIFTPENLYKNISHYENPFEFIGTDDNFCLISRNHFYSIAPSSGNFKRCFYCFSTGIHRQYLPVTKIIRYILCKFTQQVAVKGPAGKRKFL